MPPETIEISQETYSRLQQLGIPFEDTPDAVINKLLDESDRRAVEPCQPKCGQGMTGAEGRKLPATGGNLNWMETTTKTALKLYFFAIRYCFLLFG